MKQDIYREEVGRQKGRAEVGNREMAAQARGEERSRWKEILNQERFCR